MTPPRVPPRPDTARLREAALAHLARFAATRATLTRVLDRAVARWARATEADPAEVAELRAAVRAVVARLAEAGAVDDAAFAQMRARRLVRSGHSRRAAAAHLSARGVGKELTRAALAEDGTSDLAAALMFARRRRFGPFRPPGEAPPEQARRELAALARAGFPAEVARAALSMPREAAEAALAALRTS